MKESRKAVNFFRPAPLKAFAKKNSDKISKYVQRRPLTSFFAILIVLLVLIIAGNFLSKPTLEEEKVKQPIDVETYTIGNAPRIAATAQIEKEGVITISAQTPGIVHKVNVKEGQTVSRGQNLLSLSSNYLGANTASVAKQIAANQFATARVTYDAQKEIIAKQRELAQNSDENADELRQIAEKSLGETRDLVSLNESILSSIDSNIKTLESTNVGGVNDSAILQTKQLQSQFLAATNQARSALRNTELAQDKDKPPAQSAELQKDIIIKQLDLQEKTTKLQLEAAGLQIRLAQINESSFFPAAPFTGTVERVHARLGQQVAPGTPLITISSQEKLQTAVTYVPANIARSISKLDSSLLVVNGQKYEVTPIYISQEAVQGQLYAITFPIPQEARDILTDKGYIDVEIPIGYSYTSSSTPYIPLDAVHQTQDSATVFVIKDDKAEGKTVSLGQVQGNFIEITKGLEANDTVIVNRNIVSGDPVKARTP